MKKLTYFLSLLFMLILVGCGGDDDNGLIAGPGGEIEVESLQVPLTSAEVAVGLSQQYKARVILSNGEIVDVTEEEGLFWSSDDHDIATIDNDTGIATGLATGTAVITASGTVNGVDFKDSVDLIVSNAIVEADSLQITPASAEVAVGLTQQYKAQITLSSGEVVDITEEDALSWSSSDSKIATIDNGTGIATGVAPGTATMTAFGSVNGVEFSDSVELTVTDAIVEVDSLQVTPATSEIAAGLTQQYTAKVTLSNGEVVDITEEDALSWNSSDSKIATIDNDTGIATGVAPGTATITAFGNVNGVEFSDSVELTVTDAIVEVDSLQVTPATSEIAAGLTQQYTAKVTLSNGEVVDITEEDALSWNSSDSKIATIDNDTGIATGVAPGTATITAFGNVNGVEFSDSVELTVTDAIVEVDSLQVTPATSEIAAGLTQQYTAKVTLSNGEVVDITEEDALSWSSSDSKIATIDNDTGIATGVASGTATMTAFGNVNGVEFSDSVELTVTDAIVMSLEITPRNCELPMVGLTQQYTAVAKLSDQTEHDVTIDPALSWSSNNDEVASIDSDTGIVTAEGIGETTIIASGRANGEYFSADVGLTVSDTAPDSISIIPFHEDYIEIPSNVYVQFYAFAQYGPLEYDVSNLVNWELVAGDPVSASIATISDSGVFKMTEATGFGMLLNGEVNGITTDVFIAADRLSIINLDIVENEVGLAPNNKAQLTAQSVTDRGGDFVMTPIVVWKSSDPSVASVDWTGEVTANTPGSVEITATITGHAYDDYESPELIEWTDSVLVIVDTP
ncbi:Ig-like domain-containing protein [Vibrio paucivorans]|uniref:Ig-like domain-containing protein n=1 Tax=Vibrio paucivorans TaxID=2829489 RepID=A0A9X3HUR8_9VIBR|nr:Ig-like domain-containing protein [Vibrio paucivorans]MCW8336402.1 Ig-like domain-containing protein [Vibrio paucivorans]